MTPELPSLALLGTVLVTSLLGSAHCALMCGPLVSACHAGAERRGGADVAYHLTRGASYLALGGASGAVGAAVDWAGAGAGIVRIGAILSGVLVVLAGLVWIVPGLRAGVGGAGAGALASPWLPSGLVKLRRKPPAWRAAALGFVTPALPCGYLYTFVLAAAGTGSVLGGVSLMTAFWLGTLPALALLGAAVGRLSRAMRGRVPLVTGVLLVALGVLGVLGRGLAPLPAGERTPTSALESLGRGEGDEHAHCH